MAYGACERRKIHHEHAHGSGSDLTFRIPLPYSRVCCARDKPSSASRRSIGLDVSTQYLAETLKAKGVAGIFYRSLLNCNGTNVAFFSEDGLAGVAVARRGVSC